MQEQATAAHAKLTKSAGRGGLALSLSKIFFMVNGFVQQIVLSWILKDAYGAWRGALSPAQVTYNTLVSAGIQGMSRAVSRAPQSEQAAAIRRGLLIHSVLAATAGAAFFLLAPLLGRWLHSAYLVSAFRVLSLVVLFYGIYAPLIGVLNGQRRFLAQAGLDMLTALLRTLGMCLGAWWFVSQGQAWAILGASWAFVAVSGCVCLLTLVLTGFGHPGSGRPGVKEHLGFVLPVAGGQIVLNLLLQADTNTLRGFATRAAEAQGLAAEAADPLVGAYNAGQLFAFLPYQLLIGITFILFPMLASAHSQSDHVAVKTYVQAGVRIAVIASGAVVSVSSGLSASLLAFVFPPNFQRLGTESMQLLTIGLASFALYGVFSTVLNSLGKQWWALLITSLGLGCVFGANLLLVAGTPFGPQLLYRTAVSTSLGVGVAALAAGYAVHRAAGAVIRPAVVVRVVLATAVCILCARQLPLLGRVWTIVASAGVGLAYVALLTGLRELTARDLSRIATVFSRK